MFVAQQQKDYKKAIALWQDIITIANYKDDFFNFKIHKRTNR
jgi:cytochrome c-type biogenesis protein CcmH/NrfG